MARVPELPDEIIDNICSCLHSEDIDSTVNRVALYSFVLASKRCNRIAVPNLYYSLSPTSVAAGLLALTVLRRPSFAALVRTIDLETYWPVRSAADRAARMTFLEEVGDVIAAPIRQMVEGEGEVPSRTNEDLEDRRFHRRFTDFVLTRLPQVEVLALVLSDHLIDPATTHALRHRSQHVLLNAKELKVRHSDTEDGFEMSEIMPFLAGNIITKVNLFACAGFGDTTQICPSVKNLQLDRTALESDEFEKLVRCFPNLEVFAMETADSSVTQYMDDTPSAFQIGLGLEPLRDSLRGLTVDQRERFSMDEDNDDGPYSKKPLGSLKIFNKLEELVIWQFDLTRSCEDEMAANWDDEEEEEDEELDNRLHKSELMNDEGDLLMPWAYKLPRSLQTLRIIGATKEIEPGLWRLSEIAGEDCPNLKKVVSCRHVKGLRAAFQKAGVEYKVD